MLHLSKAYLLPVWGMRLCNIQLQVPEFLWYQGSFLSPQCVCLGISGEQEGLGLEPLLPHPERPVFRQDSVAQVVVFGGDDRIWE